MPRIVERLRDARGVLIAAHVLADGDAVGSEIGLARGLRSMGLPAVVVNDEELAERFRFLDPDGLCRSFDDVAIEDVLAEVDVAIVVDNNSWDRLGRLEGPLRESGIDAICLDHHVVTEPFSELHLHDTSAAATGELALDLLDQLGVALDPVIARAIYVSICSDTGWFRFSNTTPKTFEIAARLLREGVDPEDTFARINQREPLALKSVLSRFLAATSVECGGVFAWSFVTQDMVRSAGVAMRDTESFIEHIRNIEGVELVALLRELADGRTKVSVRSRGDYSAHDVVTPLGGGGHRHAAGVTLEKRMGGAVKAICDLARTQCRERASARS